MESVSKKGKTTTIYYIPHTSYDFYSPPLRGNNLQNIINDIVAANSNDYHKRFGINCASILLELPSLHFP